MEKIEITVTYVRINPESVNDGMYGTKSAVEFAVARAKVTGRELTCVAQSVDPEDVIFVDHLHVSSRMTLPRGIVLVGDNSNHEAEVMKRHAINTAVGRLGKVLSWSNTTGTREPLLPIDLQFMLPRGLPGYQPLKLVMSQVDDAVLGGILRHSDKEFGLKFKYVDQDVNIKIARNKEA